MFSEGQGCQVIWGVADYWVSRVNWDPDSQQYHLLGKDHYFRKTLKDRFSVFQVCHKTLTHVFIAVMVHPSQTGHKALSTSKIHSPSFVQNIFECFF